MDLTLMMIIQVHESARTIGIKVIEYSPLIEILWGDKQGKDSMWIGKNTWQLGMTVVNNSKFFIKKKLLKSYTTQNLSPYPHTIAR